MEAQKQRVINELDDLLAKQKKSQEEEENRKLVNQVHWFGKIITVSAIVGLLFCCYISYALTLITLKLLHE